ncbi:hypothetical protein [Sphingorhabdus lutea]|uniref:hypothetical protein n=1 Tax=Sphingorhabdus lutea TaxID=1913578 RepID=UPI0012EB2889|nr:hypothetical protein [Sphingorhabdus lutea]
MDNITHRQNFNPALGKYIVYEHWADIPVNNQRLYHEQHIAYYFTPLGDKQSQIWLIKAHLISQKTNGPTDFPYKIYQYFIDGKIEYIFDAKNGDIQIVNYKEVVAQHLNSINKMIDEAHLSDDVRTILRDKFIKLDDTEMKSRLIGDIKWLFILYNKEMEQNRFELSADKNSILMHLINQSDSPDQYEEFNSKIDCNSGLTTEFTRKFETFMGDNGRTILNGFRLVTRE